MLYATFLARTGRLFVNSLVMWAGIGGLLLPTSQAQTAGWAKSMGADSDDIGLSIAVDGSGNVYTTGYFAGTVDFDPGAGTANLTSAGSIDIFVSKLDASGNFVWAKRMGGTSADVGLSIAVDGSGNVYTTGYFAGTVDFDPGSGTANLTSAGNEDIFVSKLDASGSFVWAQRMGGTRRDYSYGIAVDGAGNVYTTGDFVLMADFDPGSGTASLFSAGGADIFVSKLDASGNFVWAQSLGGSSGDVGNDIAVDGSGNVYITGSFGGTADFDPGSGTLNLTSAGGNDIFVSKLNATGNNVWAQRMGSTIGDFGYGIAIDGVGNVYTTGYFFGTADFSNSTANLTSAGGADIFVNKLDAAGNYIWVQRLGGTSDEAGRGIAVDGTENVYTTGYFAGMADFNPGSGTLNLNSAGSNDIFVSKLQAATGALPVTLRYFNGRSTPQGHLLAWATAREAGNDHFVLERSRDLLGFEPIANVPSLAPSGNAATELSYAYTDTQPLPGTSYYRLVQLDKYGTRTLGRPISLSTDYQPPVLFPNPLPASGEAGVEPALAFVRYDVSDLLGHIVQQADKPGVLSRVSMWGLPAGLYMLRVETAGGGVQTFRVVRP